MTIASNFSAGGLASNIDWNTMVDKLVSLESQPIDTLRSNQSAIRSQVSILGTIASRVAALETAAKDLSKSGALSVTTTSVNSSFTATPGTGAVAGRYTLQVGDLAQAAKAHSSSFGATDTLAAGHLDFKVRGKDFSIDMTDGESLADVAAAIRATGAPVTATVLDDGTRKTLSITNRDTGFPLDSTVDQALSFTETTSGSGIALGLTSFQSARNATLTVDGVTLTRQSNVIADAVPGTTITLKTPNAAAEDLSLENDVSGTATTLEKFVDAYNDVIKMVQNQLAVTKNTDRTTTLAGDSTVRGLQAQIQALLTKRVAGATDVRSMADIGVKTARDGTISIDQTTLASAMSRDAAGVNALFSDPTTGLGALTQTLGDLYTNSVDGLLVTRQTSLNKTISAMDDQATALQLRIDNYRQTLIAQFTAMENTISSLKATGNYLTAQEAKSSS